MLDAAKAVFIEHGYAEATLDEVIRRSGGSRATLYKQFGDKEGLFAAIIADICAEIVAPLAKSASGQEPQAVLTGLRTRLHGRTDGAKRACALSRADRRGRAIS